jgi:hypothetical protein
LFFFRFASTKVAKTTKKKKKNFLTNIEKQIGSGSVENKIIALKEKKKRGSQSSSFAKA